MTTYLRPGVFVEETLQPLNDSVASSSDAVAAFVGTSPKGGPLGPTLVTSWNQYLSLFGDASSDKDDLGYGIYTFFQNGGAQAYVVRAVNTNATKAKLTLQDAGDLAVEDGTPVDVLDVTAVAPGAWASDSADGTAVYVTITAGASGRFDLTVEAGTGATLADRQTFVDLSLDPSDSRNALAIVNSSTVGSKYVRLSINAAQANKVFGVDYGDPDTLSATALGTSPHGTAGSDGTGTPDLFAAVQTLAGLDANLALNLPGVSDSTILTNVVNWAGTQGNVFVVIDGPKPGVNDTTAQIATALTTLENALPASSHGAVYGPWLYVQDRKVSGALRLTAPGGAVLGQYSLSDSTRGVQKVPAGTSTTLRGVINVAARFDNATLDTLNQAGVNVIRTVPGAGICIFGGRTLAKGMPDRYINIRRSLMFIERDLVNLTRFAVFETNDSDTWDSIAAVISQYLTTQWQIGMLKGDTPEQAYFVVCDDTNHDSASVNAGVVNTDVGVALSSPAEFLVIRIGQFDGGTSVSEPEA
jgi:phage tail sheath protein FI